MKAPLLIVMGGWCSLPAAAWRSQTTAGAAGQPDLASDDHGLK
jgi:hypothetical protein